ncbi:MAG: T9SS type A sorting domain-containing protein [Ignavibacteriales bacterium]|nr:T9SS type A sorting domain-containing protein [Ignavibacteriales bacterium]
MKNISLLLVAMAIFIGAFLSVHIQTFSGEEGEEAKEESGRIEGHADEAFEWWYTQRALPGTQIPPDGRSSAILYARTVMAQQRALQKTNAGTIPPWESIGPDNIGGRVLSLALSPDSSNVVYAGSASGGLWKSVTGGRGAAAWKYVQTGFPLLAVSTIAINPLNGSEIYAGTGEISGYSLGQVGTPGARTTYGLGVIKSTDYGNTWFATGLNWQFSQNSSVQKIALNPRNPSVIYAATSEGTYKSLNRGTTWFLADTVKMAMDVAVNPVDTGEVFIACGQRNTWTNPGLYKSIDGGVTWTKLVNGLPASNFGRTALAISTSNPAIVYASVANASTHALDALYKTTDHGSSWIKASLTNYLGGQGWYDNCLAVSPVNENMVLGAGLDIYKSVNGAATMTQKSYWYQGAMGVVPAGGPEGPSTYAHADHHAILFDPKDPNRIFFGTDGGVFESTDGGESFAGRNGGLITTQFYNGFANAATDSLVAVGGLQDNGTVKYQGASSWNKVYGGDGGWCAIDPLNRNILYEEYVYLAIAKSTNGGSSWKDIFTSNADSSNFIAPFVVAPSNGSVLYAGAKKIFKSTDGGTSWTATNGGTVLNGVNISCIGVSNSNADTLIAATGQRTNPIFQIFRSTNGGTTWTKTSSAIPNRYPTDIEFDPSSSSVAYCSFSGYGTSHIFASTDAGLTWSDISSNLPDIPVQSVTLDPAAPSQIYLGTDIGVYRSTNGGVFWEEFNDGMPPAMVLDLRFSLKDHRLRAATFGNGVYQRKIPLPVSSGARTVNTLAPSAFALRPNYPNPFNPSTTIGFSIPHETRVSLAVFDIGGRLVGSLVDGLLSAGTYSVRWNADTFSAGVYLIRMTADSYTSVHKALLLK